VLVFSLTQRNLQKFANFDKFISFSADHQNKKNEASGWMLVSRLIFLEIVLALGKKRKKGSLYFIDAN